MGDFDKIWREHCEDEQTLSEYALAMKNLADNHWTKQCEGEGRIEWCRRYMFKHLAASFSCGAELKHGGFRFYFHSVCQEYFLDGGMKRMLEKDEKSAKLGMAPTASPVPAQPYSTIPRWVPAWTPASINMESTKESLSVPYIPQKPLSGLTSDLAGALLMTRGCLDVRGASYLEIFS